MKMNKKRPILRRAAIPAVLALLCTLFWFGKPNDFGLGRNMELLVNMMRELSLFYVDEVDPDQLMQDAAEGMTRNLDPYTEFLPEEQMSNFDLLTTGKYGGIGSMIRKKGDYVIFAQPYEGSPADRAGIRIGDKILSIEGEDTKGWDPAQISSALKGTPNTTVRIVIERLIGGGHDTLTLTRERVAIPSVPYAGFVAKGIGYIQHSDFTEGSYEEMRTAIEKLRTQDTLRGLILDYRGNGGGILQEAVKIVSMFVPKGTEKMNKKRPILRRAAIPAVLALLCTLFWFGKPNDFGLGRNMELLVNMMRELSLFYVDEVDPDQLMQDAAEGMTRNLDPYTEFLPEEQMSNFDLLTTGKYGGIGSMIRKKGDYVIFAQPYEGSPADRAGIRIGDKILSIEGEDTKGWDPAQISSALKGTPNTTVRIVIERLIGGGHDTLTLTRERVAIPSVPYAGFVAKGIGYIQHSDFTEGSYEEMRTAIEKLRTQDTLRGLILDYRGNGGGILQEAVKIVSMFVPKGTEVVRTKGRVASQQKVFRTANDPILPDLPLAVLINGNSASAAEIVAGSLQDLDRAVLIGQKSFGKGLVQTTRPLGYNTLLKLTTAKYYIPSGRCIQAIDYSSRKQDGTVGKVADSLVREFTTRGGRKVYDGGGISPDIATEPQYISRFAVTLLAMGFIEDFVDEYMQEHHTDTIDNRTFSITDADYDAFVKFMEGKEVPYESETRRVLKVLKEAAENDLYSDLAQEITAIEGDLKDDTQTNLHTYRKEIAETINNDIVLRHSYQAGVIEHNLGDDTEVLRATEVLENPTEYQEITTVQTSEKK